MKKLLNLLWVNVILIICLLFASISQAQNLSNSNVEQPYYPIDPPMELTPSPLPSPSPTPIPTQKIVPGSPFSIGNEALQEILFQFDIMSLAQIVLVGLALMWFLIFSITITKRIVQRFSKKV